MPPAAGRCNIGTPIWPAPHCFFGQAAAFPHICHISHVSSRESCLTEGGGGRGRATWVSKPQPRGRPPLGTKTVRRSQEVPLQVPASPPLPPNAPPHVRTGEPLGTRLSIGQWVVHQFLWKDAMCEKGQRNEGDVLSVREVTMPGRRVDAICQKAAG